MIFAIARPNNECSLIRSIDDMKMMCKRFCVNTTKLFHFHFQTIEFTFYYVFGAVRQKPPKHLHEEKTNTKVIGFDARAAIAAVSISFSALGQDQPVLCVFDSIHLFIDFWLIISIWFVCCLACFDVVSANSISNLNCVLRL